MKMRTTHINTQFLAAILLTMIWVSLALFMAKVVGDINDGQRAAVCILAIAPDDRTAESGNECLRKYGLEP